MSNNWSGSKLEELELPSGNTVKINPNLSRWNLAQAGLLDEKFAPVLDALSGESTEGIPTEMAALAVEYESRLVSMATVDPKIVLDPDLADDNKVYIGEVTEEDLEAIVGAVFGVDADEFPDDGDSTGNGEDSEVLGDDTSGTDGDPKPKPASGKSKSGTRSKAK